MTTKVYGCSDDLISFFGDVDGEVAADAFGMQDEDHAGLIMCSDGTVLRAMYGDTEGRAIWKLTLLHKGTLFVGIEVCTDENADPASDVATFLDGLTFAYVAHRWDRVK
jgi:hypothetical protein